MRYIARTFLLVLVVLVALATVVVPASTRADSKPNLAAPVVLHLKFRRVITGVDGQSGSSVLTSGRYALISFSRSADFVTHFLLLDDRTGKRSMIRTAGLNEVLAFGAPWILFSNFGSLELYNIGTRKWRPFYPELYNATYPEGYVLSATVVAMGARWVEFEVNQTGSCGDGIHNECGAITHPFYNIRTGKRRYESPENTTVFDLNSSTLLRTVCRPLRVPSNGSLTFYGKFAVASEPDSEQDKSLFLERCGSYLHMEIDEPKGGPSGDLYAGDLSANTHAVLWRVLDATGRWHGRFAGRLLPSLRGFTVTLPSNIHIPVQTRSVTAVTALDSFRLYVVDELGGLWAAVLPPAQPRGPGR